MCRPAHRDPRRRAARARRARHARAHPPRGRRGRGHRAGQHVVLLPQPVRAGRGLRRPAAGDRPGGRGAGGGRPRRPRASSTRSSGWRWRWRPPRGTAPSPATSSASRARASRICARRSWRAATRSARSPPARSPPRAPPTPPRRPPSSPPCWTGWCSRRWSAAPTTPPRWPPGCAPARADPARLDRRVGGPHRLRAWTRDRRPLRMTARVPPPWPLCRRRAPDVARTPRRAAPAARRDRWLRPRAATWSVPRCASSRRLCLVTPPVPAARSRAAVAMAANAPGRRGPASVGVHERHGPRLVPPRPAGARPADVPRRPRRRDHAHLRCSCSTPPCSTRRARPGAPTSTGRCARWTRRSAAGCWSCGATRPRSCPRSRRPSTPRPCTSPPTSGPTARSATRPWRRRSPRTSRELVRTGSPYAVAPGPRAQGRRRPVQGVHAVPPRLGPARLAQARRHRRRHPRLAEAVRQGCCARSPTTSRVDAELPDAGEDAAHERWQDVPGRRRRELRRPTATGPTSRAPPACRCTSSTGRSTRGRCSPTSPGAGRSRPRPTAPRSRGASSTPTSSTSAPTPPAATTTARSTRCRSRPARRRRRRSTPGARAAPASRSSTPGCGSSGRRRGCTTGCG